MKAYDQEGGFFFLGVFCAASYLCLSSIMKQLLKEDGVRDEIRIDPLFHMQRESAAVPVNFCLLLCFDTIVKTFNSSFPRVCRFFGKRAVTSKEIPLMSLNTALIKQTQCYFEIRKSCRNKQLDILLPFYSVAQTQTT